jgi:lysophospholipase L1-like esterase
MEAQARLQEQAPTEVRFYDLGEAARASNWGLTNISQVVATRPQVAVIEFAINDAYTSFNISLAQSRTNTEGMINAIRSGSPGTRIFIMTMNPVLTSDRPNLADYYAQYRQISVDNGVGLVDNYPDWGTATVGEIPDNVHPNIEGLRRVLIPNVVKTLKPLIATM